jgi:hypothetical protein
MKIMVYFNRTVLSMSIMIGLLACSMSISTMEGPVPSTPLDGRGTPVVLETAVSLSAIPATPVPATDVSGSTDPYPLPFIKPADSDTPAAGICGGGEGDVVDVIIGTNPGDAFPLGGRCVQVTPNQRLNLKNPTTKSIHVVFGQFDLVIPSGGEVMLDQPVTRYLAYGVHHLTEGPEIWLVESRTVVTAPPPVRVYLNSELGYSLAFTNDWVADESGMTSGIGREVIVSPPNPEPFIAYVSISIDARTVPEIEQAYANLFPDAQKSAVVFAGESGLQYTLSIGRVEIIIPHKSLTFLIATDRPNDTQVQAILSSFSFTP